MMIWKYLALLSIVCLAGCENLGIGDPKITADLSTPKSAAVAYLKAIQQGDGRMARALSIGTADQKKWVDGRATLVDGMRKFDEALYAKFGHFTSQVHTDMHDSVMKLADIWVTAISDGGVTSDDNQAIIKPARSGFFSKQVLPIHLKHLKEGWKVDLAQTYAEDAGPEQIQTITAESEQWRQIGKIFQAVAGDIKAGKFRTADQASDSLADQLKKLDE